MVSAVIQFWRRPIALVLLLAGLFGMLLVVHAPNHLLSAAGRLLGQSAWIDAWQPDAPPLLRGLFWMPLALLALALRGSMCR
jgi:hypothetical protein